MKWYHWLIIPFVLLIALVLRGRRSGAMSVIKRELDALDTKAKAKRIKARQGAEQASQFVEGQYREEISKLSEYQKEEAGRLRGDPVALTNWLAGIGR